MKTVILSAAVLLIASASVHAGEGVPSKSKLNRLGLSSMQTVDDQAGMQVRGEGIGILGANFFGLANTSVFSAPGGFIAGPASPAFGTLGTINNGVNTPFTLNFTQAANGSTFIINLSAWGTVNGSAN
jgi:hypothetical protein